MTHTQLGKACTEIASLVNVLGACNPNDVVVIGIIKTQIEALLSGVAQPALAPA